MIARTLALLGVVLAAAGCREPEHHGTANVGWTIEGRADPDACTEHHAKFVHVVIRDDDGTVFGDDWPSCREQSVGYVLPNGWHHAWLTLADANHASISAPRPSSAFYVEGEREVLVVVDLTPNTIDPAVSSVLR